MNKKLVIIVMPIFIGLVIIGGIIYFVSLFSEDDQKKEASLDEFKSKTEIFSSKKEAYEQLIEDSVVKVREDNISVNLNQLFSDNSQKEAKELITEEPPKEKVIPKGETPHIKISNRKQVSFSYRPARDVQPQIFDPEKTEKAIESSNKNLPKKVRTGFNSGTIVQNTEDIEKNTLIRAVVHNKQTVYQGATIKLRAIKPFSLNGISVPENTLIYGVVSIQEERVEILVNSISFNGNITTVSLHAYDRDGIEGVYIPGLVEHDIKNESVDQAITEAQSALKVPHVASGAINVIRNKNKQVSAILTDNYQIILK